MKYLICNLKSNKDLNEILLYEHNLRKIAKKETKLIICPSDPFYVCFRNGNYELGSQDISIFNEGAFTGETNGKQLSSLGVKYVLVGHCERRAYFQENETICIKKINNAIKNGIQPIYIIGETKEEKMRGKTMTIIENQIARVFNDFTREQLQNFIICYEPVWAVGEKNNINKKDLQEIILFINKVIKDYYEIEIPIVYGGNVELEEIEKIKQIKKISGILLGKGSLDYNNVTEIYNSL